MLRLSDTLVQLKPLVVIVGPTAVGKTQVAVEVAKRFETEIVTADSLQVYRGMDIGTDKPSPADQLAVPHRLIDVVDPDQPFNAGMFRRHASAAIDRLYSHRLLPFLVGGTGLYVRTLVKGLCEAPPADPIVRAALRQEAEEKGPDSMYARLVALDPASAARLHPRDTSKVIRALEVHRLSDRPMSEFQERHGFAERPYRTLLIGLGRDRQALYHRIEQRIDRQLTAGLVDETARLLAQGCRRDSMAMKGLGYRHVAAFLSGEYDFAEMVRRFKRDTRNFAKRQLTWFRSEPGIRWLSIEEEEPPTRTAERVIEHVTQFLSELEGTSGVVERAGEGA